MLSSIITARNDDEEIEEFDRLISGDVIPDTGIEDLLPSVDALRHNRADVEILQRSGGRMNGSATDSSLWNRSALRSQSPRISSGRGSTESHRDTGLVHGGSQGSGVQNQFRLMFPEEISDGAYLRNPSTGATRWRTCRTLSPRQLATARNERWDQEQGFTPDEADVAYDQDGIMIVRMLKPRAATATLREPVGAPPRHHRQGLSRYHYSTSSSITASVPRRTTGSRLVHRPRYSSVSRMSAIARSTMPATPSVGLSPTPSSETLRNTTPVC